MHESWRGVSNLQHPRQRSPQRGRGFISIKEKEWGWNRKGTRRRHRERKIVNCPQLLEADRIEQLFPLHAYIVLVIETDFFCCSLRGLPLFTPVSSSCAPRFSKSSCRVGQTVER